jgi:cytochrome c oxidase assembly factor CtaG
MIQHLLLMTIAPALILLGDALLVFCHAVPRFSEGARDRVFRRPLARRLTRMLSRPSLCWTASALTLLGWHVPAPITLATHSEVWHLAEQPSFFGAGLLFWLPVIQPWPFVSMRRSGGPFYTSFLPRCRATFPPDFLSSLTVLPIPCSFPRGATLAFLFWKISNVPLL